jgi:hypothetical protein
MLVINFDSGIYNERAVKKAIGDYRALADFSYRTQKGNIVVRIRNIRNKELEPSFSAEFSNYVLSLLGILK